MAIQQLFDAELAWVSDIEPAACQVLATHHPNVPNIGDITTINWNSITPVDILTAGYPCQPFSHAGARKGTDDERHLWPYVKTAISEMGPRFVFLENVRGHLTLGFTDVLADLAELGYDAKWGVVRASDAGAPHQRSRLFIVANPNGTRLQRHLNRGSETSALRQGSVELRLSIPTNSKGTEWGRSQPNHLRSQRSSEFGERPSASPHPNSEPHRSDRRSTRMENEILQHTHNSWSSEKLSTRFSNTNHDDQNRSHSTDFGPYTQAIKRWEHILGRPAPAPSITPKNKPRLNPLFVEWMMGLPEGWVTGHQLTPSQELKMLGNGVVPQQAYVAYRTLL